MLMITSFTNPRVAQAFVDYMATQGVILTIQQHERSDVWLSDEAQEARDRSELERFLANPADPRYLAASWQSGVDVQSLYEAADSHLYARKKAGKASPNE